MNDFKVRHVILDGIIILIPIIGLIYGLYRATKKEATGRRTFARGFLFLRLFVMCFALLVGYAAMIFTLHAIQVQIGL